MKRLSPLLFILLFTNCSHKNTGDDFTYTYMKSISIIEEYGYCICTDWNVEIDLETLGAFCDAADYLESLTGINYHYTYVDIPVYESDSAVLQDVQYLRWWYETYGREMTKEEADLIVKKCYDNHTSNPPNIDSVIVRWNKIQERKLFDKMN
jgi:hypothetical protein